MIVLSVVLTYEDDAIVKRIWRCRIDIDRYSPGDLGFFGVMLEHEPNEMKLQAARSEFKTLITAGLSSCIFNLRACIFLINVCEAVESELRC